MLRLVRLIECVLVSSPPVVAFRVPIEVKLQMLIACVV